MERRSCVVCMRYCVLYVSHLSAFDYFASGSHNMSLDLGLSMFMLSIVQVYHGAGEVTQHRIFALRTVRAPVSVYYRLKQTYYFAGAVTRGNQSMHKIKCNIATGNG